MNARRNPLAIAALAILGDVPTVWLICVTEVDIKNYVEAATDQVPPFSGRNSKEMVAWIILIYSINSTTLQ
jgi:hypothetical protein